MPVRDEPMFAAPPPPELHLSKRLVGHKLGKDEKVTYSAYRVTSRVQCDECVSVLHEAGGKGWAISSATVSRKEGTGGKLLLCSGHARLWRALDGVGEKRKKASR